MVADDGALHEISRVKLELLVWAKKKVVAEVEKLIMESGLRLE